MSEKITVITVTYNCKSVIEKTILSVINQTYDNIEYIIVDGASSDGTLDVIQRYNKHIDKIVSERDNGVYDAMNKGVKLATGEWICMMNAGDYFYNDNTIKQVFLEFNNNPYANAIYSDFELRYSNNVSKITEASVEKAELLHQAVIYRKSLHYEHGFYCVKRPNILADALFLYRIPEEEYVKVNSIIASYDMGGLSNQGNWGYLQLYSFRYIFHKVPISVIAKLTMKAYLKEFTPKPIWNFIKAITKVL